MPSNASLGKGRGNPPASLRHPSSGLLAQNWIALGSLPTLCLNPPADNRASQEWLEGAVDGSTTGNRRLDYLFRRLARIHLETRGSYSPSSSLKFQRSQSNMLKFVLSRKYPFLSIFNERHRRQLDALKQANEDLRVRLVTAQEAKVQALKQAEEIRKEKERLRSRVTMHKQTNETLSKVNDRLQTKLQSLQEENESLKQSVEDLTHIHRGVQKKGSHPGS